jgi:hypothetical protein
MVATDAVQQKNWFNMLSKQCSSAQLSNHCRMWIHLILMLFISVISLYMYLRSLSRLHRISTQDVKIVFLNIFKKSRSTVPFLPFKGLSHEIDC